VAETRNPTAPVEVWSVLTTLEFFVLDPTDKVGPAPAVKDRPEPKIISSTLVSEFVPLSVLAPPGLSLGLVTLTF
jgi:hypothetical protein